MTSYLSNILVTTTNKYTTLRRALLPDEADGDTEDDTHISRSLRAYYIEKQRPFPTWLPPDPNDRRPPPAAYGGSPSPYAQQGSNYFTGGRGGTPGASPAAPGQRKGGLSDLWDSGPAPAQPPQPQSLRARPAAPSPAHSYTSQSSVGSARPDRRGAATAPPPQSARARPLPSQREGSYQTRSEDPALAGARAAAGAGGAPPPMQRATSTQDRLKARLWGAGGNGGAPGAAAYR